jgi:hypothetical protein
MLIRKKWTRNIVVLTLGVLATTMVVYAAGTKKPNEECKADDECRKGHCYTKKSDSKQVCVDCSSSTISGYRDDVQEWCKETKRACKGSSDLEVAESYYTTRIEANEKCIRARKGENKDCWDDGDDGHQRAVTEAETALSNCNSDFSTRKSEGTIYNCSDSSYTSKATDAQSYCNDYGNACDSMSKDSSQVDCREIESAMVKTDKCVVAVEKLDSDCLPRLSRKRETQFGKAKTAYDKCKEILAYKKDNKLCK